MTQPRAERECADCRERREIHAKDLCKRCYMRECRQAHRTPRETEVRGMDRTVVDQMLIDHAEFIKELRRPNPNRWNHHNERHAS